MFGRILMYGVRTLNIFGLIAYTAATVSIIRVEAVFISLIGYYGEVNVLVRVAIFLYTALITYVSYFWILSVVELDMHFRGKNFFFRKINAFLGRLHNPEWRLYNSEKGDNWWAFKKMYDSVIRSITESRKKKLTFKSFLSFTIAGFGMAGAGILACVKNRSAVGIIPVVFGEVLRMFFGEAILRFIYAIVSPVWDLCVGYFFSLQNEYAKLFEIAHCLLFQCFK